MLSRTTSQKPHLPLKTKITIISDGSPPGGEVDLCGHATLATAFVILNFYDNTAEVHFKTNDNVELTVKRKDNLYEMEFPAYDLKQIEISDEITDALGVEPEEAFIGRDLLCVLDNPESVVNFKADLEKIEKLDGLILHITSRGNDYDCVSRSFAPKLNISEDPVCGSGHCHIVPYWSWKLKKDNISAFQASKRSGELYCEIKNKIILAGEAVLFSESKINIK